MEANFDTDEVSVSEIAAEYGLSQPTIRVWVHRGLINARPHGRAWMVSRTEVAQMLADNPKLGKPRNATRDPQRTPAPAQTPKSTPTRGPDHYSLVEELGLQ